MIHCDGLKIYLHCYLKMRGMNSSWPTFLGRMMKINSITIAMQTEALVLTVLTLMSEFESHSKH